MSGQKLLHELLDEDQEPFFVAATYIKKNHTQLQLKKPKPISQPARLAGKLKNSCFFTLPDSPDPRKSPICFSVRQSPKSPNNIFLHVPAKTASLLLEAALKIQRNSAAAAAAKRSPPRFGLFGSLFKRLTHKTKKRSIETVTDSSCRKTSRSDVSTRDHDSLSDGGDDLVGVDEIDVMISDAEFDFCHESPFRFVLQRSPPRSGDQTPDLPSSPATSPIRHKFELGRNNISTDGESLKKLTVDEDEEQCSPVCVLDPPFEDDEDDEDEAHEHELHGDNKDDAFDYECSYAIVQRAKQHLLKKLYRFEKLAELDPVELEKRMLEEQYYSSDGDSTSAANDADYYYNNNDASSVTQVLESSFHHPNNVPDGMKKLVADLIAEEERKQRDRDREVVARGVCRRLETWKEVDLDTIDMMVDLDLRIDADGWVKRPDQEQVSEAAAEIEVAIFGRLVDELTASV